MLQKRRGSYKMVLDCTDDVKAFYEKHRFRQVSNQIRYDGKDV